jgi:hypothetical protein
MSLTLAEYAAKKNLSVERLRELGVRDVSGDEATQILRWERPVVGGQGIAGIAIPYVDAHGAVVFERVRLSMKSRPYQPSGTSPIPYGLAWLREDPFVVICEGESCAHSYLTHDVNVLAVPGSNFAESWAEYIAPYSRVYFYHEGGKGADTLAQKIVKVRPDALAIRVEGFKDASEIQMRQPADFRRLIEGAMQSGWVVTPEPDPERLPRTRIRGDLPEIVALARLYTRDLIRRGQCEWWAPCPLPDHNETEPSFHVNEDKQTFYCFGCCRGGGVVRFLELVGDQSLSLQGRVTAARIELGYAR